MEMNAVNSYGQGSKSWEEVARNAMADRADLLRENTELKNFSAGLEANLAAVIQRAEAATLPGGKTLSGAKKKALAIGAALATIPLPPKQKAAVGVVNDAIVAAFNIAGLFAKKAPAK